ncbi:hypothetical protein GCM10027082_19640 [Comamonas humi]
MDHFNQQMFAWLAAGYEPHAVLLALSRLLADGGGWLAFAGVAWVAWRKPSQFGYLLCAVAVAGLAALAAHVLAAFINHPRPFMVGLSPAYVSHAARGSLPSAHATVLWTLACICLQRLNLLRLGLWVSACALATCWARIYAGIHFPLDILAGMGLGATLAVAFGVARLVVLRGLALLRSAVGHPPASGLRTLGS